jgi:hypothetical protein
VVVMTGKGDGFRRRRRSGVAVAGRYRRRRGEAWCLGRNPGIIYWKNLPTCNYYKYVHIKLEIVSLVA